MRGVSLGVELEHLPALRFPPLSGAGLTIEFLPLSSVTLRYGPGRELYLQLAQRINEPLVRCILGIFLRFGKGVWRMVLQEIVRRQAVRGLEYWGPYSAFGIASAFGLVYLVTEITTSIQEEGRHLGKCINYAEGYVRAALRREFPLSNYSRDWSWRAHYRGSWDDGELAVLASNVRTVKSVLERSFREGRAINPRFPLQNLVHPMGVTLARPWQAIMTALSKRERRATA